MAFFRNDTVNLLNLHYGIHMLAMSGGGAFYEAFLLRAGVPPALVLASIALIVAGRFAIRPLMLMPARRFGLRPLVVAGTMLTALQFPSLAEVHGVGWELFAWCALAILGGQYGAAGVGVAEPIPRAAPRGARPRQRERQRPWHRRR